MLNREHKRTWGIMPRAVLVTLLVLLASPQRLTAQDTLTVMSYNILNYDVTYSPRDPAFRTILNAVKPDVLVVQEINTQAAVDNFLTRVLNFDGLNEYAAGTFIDGTIDTENAIFYKTATVTFGANRRIAVPPPPGGGLHRDINEFTIYGKSTQRPLLIYSVHLKAGSSDSTRRAQEVQKLRSETNALPEGSHFIVLGDFNIYSSYESAYQDMLRDEPGNDGHFVDHLRLLGIWNYSGYSIHHTQSTRSAQSGDFSGGGLDDRFDMILRSRAVDESDGVSMVPGSYRAYGNDGFHYNADINAPNNNAVGQVIADALFGAADHIPVIAQFVFDPVVSVEEEESSLPRQFQLGQNYPNPFNPSTFITLELPAESHVSLRVFDVLGREVSTLVDRQLNAGFHRFEWRGVSAAGSPLPGGIYFYTVSAGGISETRKMLLVR